MATRTQVAAEVFIIVLIAALLINIQQNVIHFQPVGGNWTLYERSNQSFKNTTSAAISLPIQIGLNETRNATAHNVSIGEGGADGIQKMALTQLVNATTDPIGVSVLIPASSPVNFTGKFGCQDMNDCFATWHLYALFANGTQSQICQSGNDSTGGAQIDANSNSPKLYNGTCTSPSSSITLSPSDKLRLKINIWDSKTGEGTTKFVHVWDDLVPSRVIIFNASVFTPIGLVVMSAPSLIVHHGSMNSTIVTVTNTGSSTSYGINVTQTCPGGMSCVFNVSGNFSLAPNATAYLMDNVSAPPGFPPSSFFDVFTAIDNASNSGNSTTMIIVPNDPSFTGIPVGGEFSFCMVQNTTTSKNYTLNNTGNSGLGPFTCDSNASIASNTSCPTSIPVGTADNATYLYNASVPLGTSSVLLTFNATNATNATQTVLVDVTVLNGIPIIENKTNLTVTDNNATIFWQTTELGNSSLCLGTTNTSLTICGGSAAETLNHTLGIFNLTNDTTYFYQATSCNCAGCNSSDIENFTTSSPPANATPTPTVTPTITPTATPTPTPTPTPPPCGAVGEACCSEGICDEGLVCTEGICATPTPTPSPTPTPAAPGGGGGPPGTNIIITTFGPTGPTGPTGGGVLPRGACTFRFDPAPRFPATNGYTEGDVVSDQLICDGLPVPNAAIHTSCSFDTTFDGATDVTGHSRFPSDGLGGAVCVIAATKYNLYLIAGIYHYGAIPVAPPAPRIISRGLPPQPPFGLYLSILAIIILLLLLAYFRRRWIARLLGMEQGQGRR